jgi:hypothetical protein
MSDLPPDDPSPCAVPPVLDPDAFERYEGFRETTLAYFTEPEDNRALRHLGEMLFDKALESIRHGPIEPEGMFFQQARAAVADLRHLQGFLAHLDRERVDSALTKAEDRISMVCGRLAGQIKRAADALDKAIGPRP